MGKLYDKLFSTTLSGLEASGYKKTIEEVDELNFGNEIIIFASQKMRIRFISDRSDIIIEVAALYRPDSWHELATVLEFLKIIPVDDEPIAIEKLGKVLITHLGQIENNIAGGDTDRVVEELGAYEKKRSKQLIDRLKNRSRGNK